MSAGAGAATGMVAGQSALLLAGIRKRCGTTQALAGATLDATRGRVHALVGENGAGKTTLMRIAYGLERPDAGQVSVGGRPLASGVVAALQAGLGMVHQHFMLAEALTVVENVVLGREPMRGGLVDWARARREVAELGQRYGLAVEPDARVDTLGVGEKQRVEIVKVLWRGADIIILDEPTAVLGPTEAAGLLEVVRGLRAAGKTVVLITHKLDEVMAAADDVTVLRRGLVVTRKLVAETSAAELARAMVGHDVTPPEVEAVAPRAVVLELRGLRAGRLQGVDLEVRGGEIVGVAGVEGNGQRELIEGIIGLCQATGQVRVGGVDLSGKSVAERLAAGLAHVPEDRQRRGLVLEFTLEDNLVLGRLGEFAGRFGLDRARVRAHARQVLGEHDVRPAQPTALASVLSGGNQQKLVLARELRRPGTKLLLCAQPTRGVDIAAAAEIHKRLLAARAAGMAILLVSADLGELRLLSDRIVVMLRGRINGAFTREDATEAKLGALMTATSTSTSTSTEGEA